MSDKDIDPYLEADKHEGTAYLKLKIEVMHSGAVSVRNIRYGRGTVVAAFLTEAMQAEEKETRLRVEEYINTLCRITACDENELREHLTRVAAETGFEKETVLKSYLSYLEDKREEQKNGAKDGQSQEDAG